MADRGDDEPTREMMRYYCALHWDRGRIDAAVGRAADWARQHHAALVVGEFGASAALNQPARLAWLRATRQSFEAARIGWALWGYDDVMGFAVARPPAHRPMLDSNILTALGHSGLD
jgi:hypothetical protein